jgi:ABC-type spermidine/putrescine transport system permease subunit I
VVAVAPKARPARKSVAGPIYAAAPTAVLAALFIGPMLILLYYSFQETSFGVSKGWTLDNYTGVLTDPTYAKVMMTTVIICTAAMLVMLALAIPLAYLLAFRMKPKAELLFLLLLVLSEELNPLIRVYAWRTILGREGVVNFVLTRLGLTNEPIDVLLFSSFAVVVVLATTFIPYTTIPIYAALKAVDPSLLEAADDLGAGFATRFRKLLLPLAAPGIFVAIILVYIPLYSEFATPSLVGGTSGYMIGNAIQELILEAGDRGGGAAMSFLLLVVSGAIAFIGYRLGRLKRLQATA